MSTIYESVLEIPASKTFSLKDKTLRLDTEADVEPYLSELDNFKDLEKVDLSGNTISPEASKVLAQHILKHKDTLQELNLQDIYTTRDKYEIPMSLKELLGVAQQMPNLKVLNLSDNAIGQEAIDTVTDFLTKSKYVEHLILSNNGLGPKSGSKVGKALYQSAKLRESSKESDENVRTLKTFWCGRNRLEDGSTDYLSLGLKANGDLEDVRLYQDGIRPEGVAKLIRHGLSNLNNLKVLDLNDNTFTIPGSRALAESISEWPELKVLNVNDCLLKAKGGLAFLEKLRDVSDKSKLEEIKLQYNELDSDSLKVLSSLLPLLKEHRLLELNGNAFDEEDEHLEKIKSIFDTKGQGELDELDALEEPDSEFEDEEPDSEEEEENRDLDEDVYAQAKDTLESLEKELAETHI